MPHTEDELIVINNAMRIEADRIWDYMMEKTKSAHEVLYFTSEEMEIFMKSPCAGALLGEFDDMFNRIAVKKINTPESISSYCGSEWFFTSNPRHKTMETIAKEQKEARDFASAKSKISYGWRAKWKMQWLAFVAGKSYVRYENEMTEAFVKSMLNNDKEIEFERV